MTDITYESRILLSILTDLDKKYGFTVGNTSLIEYVRGYTVKSLEFKNYTKYHGKLTELYDGYLNKVINYLVKKNYIEEKNVSSNSPSNRRYSYVYIVTDKGKEFLNSDEKLYCDKVYRKYLIPGILQFDPELYKKLYNIYNSSAAATRLAIYLPDNLQDIELYIKSKNNSISSDTLAKLLECIQNHKNNYINIVMSERSNELSVGVVLIQDIILNNSNKLKIIDEELSFNNIGLNFLYQLGLYVKKDITDNLNLYFIDIFCKAYPLTSEIQNTIIEYLKASKKM